MVRSFGSKRMVTTSQEADFISKDHVWITRASSRTYLQAVFGTPQKKRLVVEIRETQTQNHRDLIQQIADHIKCNKVTKEQVKVLRDGLVSKES